MKLFIMRRAKKCSALNKVPIVVLGFHTLPDFLLDVHKLIPLLVYIYYVVGVSK